MKRLTGWLLAAAICGCASKPPAPVVERAPAAEQTPARAAPETASKPAPPPATPPAAVAAPEADWRPESIVVKKGDTLHAIGLEYGLDYKDIAAWNNIPPPYVIRIGQKLRLKETRGARPAAPAAKPAETEVSVTPLKTETAAPPKPLNDAASPADAKPTETAAPQTPVGEPPLLSEPKVTKERYSEKAMAATKPAEKAAQSDKAGKPQDQPDGAANKNTAAEADAIDWAWPVNGKILTGFNDAAGAKGIDIAGTAGQPVYAAAGGKVVYSGSTLRGYGKLIVIKHNATYFSAYAHNSQLLVKDGQEVTKGQKIAEMGSTDTDRPKLHFEIRKLGKPVDPAKYLPAGAGVTQ